MEAVPVTWAYRIGAEVSNRCVKDINRYCYRVTASVVSGNDQGYIIIATDSIIMIRML